MIPCAADGGSHESLYRRIGPKPVDPSAECIDDYVEEHNPVRAIDAFIDMLDLAALGFNVGPEATGRPGYHPATVLKILDG